MPLSKRAHPPVTGPAEGVRILPAPTHRSRFAAYVNFGVTSSRALVRDVNTIAASSAFCKAFREAGRVIRTVQLLRFLSGPQLRARTTAATSKAGSCNNFAAWCRFGNGGVIAGNDPGEQKKIVKFSTLLTNCVVFHTTVDMMAALRDLIAEGWTITAADLAVLSPYLTARIQRFGVYATDEIALTPDAYDARLGVGLVRKVQFATMNMPSNSGNKLLVFGCECSVSDTHRISAAEGGQLPGATGGAHARRPGSHPWPCSWRAHCRAVG